MPSNDPLATVAGWNVGTGVGGGVGGAVGGSDGATDGADAVGMADGGALDALATTGGGSTSAVRMKIGEPRYQPAGMAISSAIPTTAAVRPGCRRAAASQPRRHATSAMATATATEAIATGTRSSYRPDAMSFARSPIEGMVAMMAALDDGDVTPDQPGTAPGIGASAAATGSAGGATAYSRRALVR